MPRGKKTPLHPEGYHGRGRRPPYFEGWYFKVVDPAEKHRFAIIPGISLSTGEEGPHSFVQVLDGTSGRTVYQRYPVEAFTASERWLEIDVGPNHFSAAGMSLNLTDTELSISGTVTFDELRPWPVTVASPGIMGWYAWVPRMETYHGVVSLDHGLGGSLTIGDQTVSFSGGRGYIEKDWGQSFPSGWVWMQSNHFGTPGVCLTASIAMIPWIGHSFPGFIVGLYREGTLYRFATYTGAVTRHLAITENEVEWVIEDSLYRLDLVGRRAESGLLRGPSRVDMGRPVAETLSASIDVELRARRSDTLIYRGTGSYAGMEVVGKVDDLLTAAGKAGGS
ncbi:MAG: tocopherol cyclase family protein [Anaerolineae bacterium]